MPFVAYYRVSTDKQGKSGLGLEAQRKAVKDYIGAAPDSEFTEVESGKRADRPVLAEALDWAELTGSTLIVAKLDRLSRDAEFLNRLAKSPIAIKFADMPQADTFMIGIMAQIAQWEREQISSRTKAALAAAKARGTTLGGDRGNLAASRSLGAQRSREIRSAASKARAMKVLPHIEAARAAGNSSLRKIATYLNGRQIKSPRGKAWGPATVQRVLSA